MMFDPNYLRGMTMALSQSSATEQTLTNELSSGLRVTRLSDDPAAVSRNAALSGSISSLDSFVKTSTTEQSRMQIADDALGQVVSQVTKALSFAISAGNGTMNATDLSAVQTQVEQIRGSVIALANTSYQGQYVFSGSQGSTTPFTLNTATNPATTTYNGDNVISQTQTPNGQQIATSVPGSSVFMGPGSSLLGTLNQLVSDIAAAASGTGSTAAIQTDSSALTQSLDTVSTQRATLDSGLSQMITASTYASTQATVYSAQQSALLSADPAAVAIGLSAVETQHQALLGVTATLEGAQNLFAYLK
jgi:flagellar hook-associated protein 3 FlgL